jgi:hypothetical protein
MPPGNEALGLGVIDAVNQSHEFRHDVAISVKFGSLRNPSGAS